MRKHKCIKETIERADEGQTNKKKKHCSVLGGGGGQALRAHGIREKETKHKVDGREDKKTLMR